MRKGVATSLVAVAAILGILAFAGCASAPIADTGTTAPTAATVARVPNDNTGPVNAADVTFAEALSTIGVQNMAMADLVAGRSTQPELATLVPAIRQHQPDLDAMHEWLGHWATTGIGGAPTSSGVPVAAMEALKTLHGADFDDRWLEHMGANYAAAIAACDAELAHGVNPQARQMASNWKSWMHDHYGRMQHWHSSWMHDSRFPMMMGTTPGGSSARPTQQTTAPSARTTGPSTPTTPTTKPTTPTNGPGSQRPGPPRSVPTTHHPEPPRSAPGTHHPEPPHTTGLGSHHQGPHRR